jgi:hypothetical protein
MHKTLVLIEPRLAVSEGLTISVELFKEHLIQLITLLIQCVERAKIVRLRSTANGKINRPV